jgi:hypothetical protein
VGIRDESESWSKVGLSCSCRPKDHLMGHSFPTVESRRLPLRVFIRSSFDGQRHARTLSPSNERHYFGSTPFAYAYAYAYAKGDGDGAI